MQIPKLLFLITTVTGAFSGQCSEGGSARKDDHFAVAIDFGWGESPLPF
jgi:hypothetical protein